MIRKKVISILLGITVFLLLLNLVVELFTEKQVQGSIPGYSVTEAENTFFSTLNNFGVTSDWIKIVNKKIPGQDSLKHIIRVDIPQDLALPIFFSDLKRNYPDTLKLISSEIKKHGNSDLALFSKDIQLLAIQFNYSDKVLRPFCKFCFVIKPLETIDESLLARIIRNPYPFSIAMMPSFNNEKEIEKLQGLDKNYVVLLNDEISDNKFLLSSSSSKQRLKGSVEAIVKSFGGNNYYIIDDKSSLFNSPSFNFIRDEFGRNKITLHKLSGLVDFKEKEEKDIQSLIRFYSSSAPADTCISMLIDMEKYLSLKSFISDFKKKGHNIALINNCTKQ